MKPSTNNNSIPFKATHPGSLLKDELEAREISQKDFALQLVIKGKRPITADLAILLESLLQIPADYWLRFQSQYEIQEARIKEKNILKLVNIGLWEIIKECIPVNYFKKLGYFVDDLASNIAKVHEIFNVTTIDELVGLKAKAQYKYFRKSDKLTADDSHVLAWSGIVKYEASKMEVEKYNAEKIEELTLELQAIFYKNKDVIEKTKQKLQEYGIKLIIVERPQGKTPIDGLAFWSGDNPAIALGMRYNRVDNFAFTIMHEIGHFVLHLSDKSDSEILESSNKQLPIEIEADEYAKAGVIPKSLWDEVCKIKQYNDAPIIAFSKKYKIHATIIFGRICNHNANFKVSTTIDKTLH
jgi:HTH-type transcriptional regulator/antitoxin HigA